MRKPVIPRARLVFPRLHSFKSTPHYIWLFDKLNNLVPARYTVGEYHANQD